MCSEFWGNDTGDEVSCICESLNRRYDDLVSTLLNVLDVVDMHNISFAYKLNNRQALDIHQKLPYLCSRLRPQPDSPKAPRIELLSLLIDEGTKGRDSPDNQSWVREAQRKEHKRFPRASSGNQQDIQPEVGLQCSLQLPSIRAQNSSNSIFCI